MAEGLSNKAKKRSLNRCQAKATAVGSRINKNKNNLFCRDLAAILFWGSERGSRSTKRVCMNQLFGDKV